MKFTNPVLNENVGDPTVWENENNYYLFYTGNFNSTIYHSVDMINWVNTGICPFTNETQS